MRPFIVTLDKGITKRNPLMAFRHKSSCKLNLRLLRSTKTFKSVYQALSWSEYKKTNTIKYLVSCTPSGLVNYVSPGYGGKITDNV